jgi:hypothetical protein
VSSVRNERVQDVRRGRSDGMVKRRVTREVRDLRTEREGTMGGRCHARVVLWRTSLSHLRGTRMSTYHNASIAGIGSDLS